MQGKYPDILKTIKQSIYANFLQPTICYKTAIAIKRELLKSQKGNDDDDWPPFLLNYVQAFKA